jgi:hypothetical protein
MKPTGYKATRKGPAQRRRETREKIWTQADVPPSWEAPLADRETMREMLAATRLRPVTGV